LMIIQPSGASRSTRTGFSFEVLLTADAIICSVRAIPPRFSNFEHT
jgi:hypothetical protein